MQAERAVARWSAKHHQSSSRGVGTARGTDDGVWAAAIGAAKSAAILPAPSGRSSINSSLARSSSVDKAAALIGTCAFNTGSPDCNCAGARARSCTQAPCPPLASDSSTPGKRTRSGARRRCEAANAAVVAVVAAVVVAVMAAVITVVATVVATVVGVAASAKPRQACATVSRWPLKLPLSTLDT